MSRRNVLVLLAASAALIATHAAADPECFGDTCRLPAVVEPPATARPVPQPTPETRISVAPQAPMSADVPVGSVASEAFAKAPPPPEPMPRLAPSSERPLAVAEPAYRKPAGLFARDVAPPVLRAPEPRRAEPPRAPGRTTAWVEQGQIDPGPLFGIPFTATSRLVGVPTVIYGGFGVRPVYLVAPSAKIIHIDRED